MAEVLRGKSPEEMPFYQPTRFQQAIAREQRSESDRASTRTVPRADEVIE
jgi:hypothetical protein